MQPPTRGRIIFDSIPMSVRVNKRNTRKQGRIKGMEIISKQKDLKTPAGKHNRPCATTPVRTIAQYQAMTTMLMPRRTCAEGCKVLTTDRRILVSQNNAKRLSDLRIACRDNERPESIEDVFGVQRISG